MTNKKLSPVVMLRRHSSIGGRQETLLGNELHHGDVICQCLDDEISLEFSLHGV